MAERAYQQQAAEAEPTMTYSEFERLQQQQSSRNAKVKFIDGQLVPEDLDGVYRFARFTVMAGMDSTSWSERSKMSEDERIARTMMQATFGMALGFSMPDSLLYIAIINNKPCLWGNAIPAVILRHPKYENWREWTVGTGDEFTCFCEFKRSNMSEPVVRSFSMSDARRAQLLGKDTYKQYPQRMLAMRARAFAAKDSFPDALMGVRIAEEEMSVKPSDPGAVEDRPTFDPDLVAKKRAEVREAAERESGDPLPDADAADETHPVEVVDEPTPEPVHTPKPASKGKRGGKQLSIGDGDAEPPDDWQPGD